MDYQITLLIIVNIHRCVNKDCPGSGVLYFDDGG